MELVVQGLYAFLEQKGLKGRVVSVQRLADLQRDVEGRQAQGAFDTDFYRERLTFFSFSPPDNLPQATSLIVVAVPRPQTRVRFTWNERTLALILPPTYVPYLGITQQVGDVLTEWLAPHGYHVALAKVPLKLLAVCSGLAEYGRNNITYVSGMGSFLQLTAFYSDLPPAEDDWYAPRVMERCQKCEACLRSCPTQAITSERFLLHAERCLVFHNERSRERPFPDWIDPAAHNCLIGCMRCQQCCPEDKPFLGWIEGDEEFSHAETSLLLAGASLEQLPPTTVKKLERLELLDALESMPRNLGVFFKMGAPTD